ncbi:C-type lectin domain family 12 member A isoform X1 [Equus asinus]|uniref:C-type lectin domain family 12 member A isoform X1 n=1 Tax=Equus asinus TaxID=9793 RepID=UPI00071A9418|nr:C-type lectin domain family 12 member A isoform X1 [Equus asinus]XP_044612262.1 C-type lectin domain family 12 member A isoform X1 [Equus asinus]
MSEEVTYADLKFHDSSKTENIQEFDQLGIKVLPSTAPPAPSRAWRQRVVALTLLCLLLLTGLGVLGSMFYITLKTEVGKLNELQNFKEDLQRNISIQLMHNMNNSEKIRNLSITLQEIATKLCHELYRNNQEHKCKPCPKQWIWHEDSCYVLLEGYKAWQKSEKICSSHNASLLKIKNKSVLEFIKSRSLRNHWLGLSPRKDYTPYKLLDETIISSDWFRSNTNDLSNGKYCGYIHDLYVYYDECTSLKNAVCEKLANPVKIESTLMKEVPDGGM